jgi:hypothetical protein
MSARTIFEGVLSELFAGRTAVVRTNSGGKERRYAQLVGELPPSRR